MCNGTSKRRCLPTRISQYERLLHGRYIPPRPKGGLASARCRHEKFTKNMSEAVAHHYEIICDDACV
jgi:hypothetical protein